MNTYTTMGWLNDELTGKGVNDVDDNASTLSFFTKAAYAVQPSVPGQNSEFHSLSVP